MSSYFQWDPVAYTVHVREFDKDHETIVGMMNKLHELHDRHAGRAELKAALDPFVAFTLKHFANEEAYMERIGYPGYRTHVLIHKNLVQRVTQFAEQFQARGEFGDDFFVFLNMWLKSHICGVDAKYGEHKLSRAG